MPHRTTVSRMQDRDLVAAFVAGEPDGPVGYYTVKVPAGLAAKVTVAPSSGSLPAGGYVVVTVTVTSKAALSTDLTVEPGNLTVSVVYKINAEE